MAAVIWGTPNMDVLVRSQSMILTKEELQQIKSSFPACFKHCPSLVITDGSQCETSLSKLFEKGVKVGKDFIGTDDPFDAIITVIGKTAVGSFLSKMTTCQCAGLVGFIVNTLHPEVNISVGNYVERQYIM